MKELVGVRQIPGELRRRWFLSANFDLIVWVHADEALAGFELCYDKTGAERSLRWFRANGFTHTAVDDGENRPGKYKATPILVPDGHFDAKRVHSDFAKESSSLPIEVAALVLENIARYPSDSAAL